MSGERCRQGCIVDRCPNNHKKKKRHKPEVKLYPFPEDSITKKKWIEILSLVGYNHEKNAKICSIHFLKSDFGVNEVGSFVLKINALPSVNLDLVLLGNEVVEENIASTEDPFNVGVSRNRTSGPEIIRKNHEDADLSYDFLNTLKKSFLNTEYCTDYISQLISTCINDNSVENVITAAKKNQISTLKNLKICAKGGTYNYKQRLYLYMQEEKNRTYAKIKTQCFGRCRLCLYCFKNSDLLLFSSQQFIGDNDITIKDCLMSLFPSLSDNFQLNHEICITCYDHLLTTLQFFKMTLTVEGLLNTVLKNQPFIFNEKQKIETVVVKREVELEDENKNTSPSCLNGTLSFFSDMEDNHENSTSLEPFLNEAPLLHSLLNKLEDNSVDNSFATHIDSEPKEWYEKKQMMENLEDQQKDVLSKVINLLAPIKSADDLVSLDASNNNDDHNDESSDMNDSKQVYSYLLDLNNDNNFSEPPENQIDHINKDNGSNVIPCNYLADLPQTDSFQAAPSGLSQFTEDGLLSEISVMNLKKENKLAKVILHGKDDFPLTNESDFDLANENESHIQDIDFVNIKPDTDITIKFEENDKSNDLVDTYQFNEPNEYVDVMSKDPYTLTNIVNSGNTYVDDDFKMSDTGNARDENYSIYVSSAHSEVVGNMSVTEKILRSELNNTSCLLQSLTVITPPVLNPETIEADFLDNLKVISLDFNMANEKRIIFLGGMYCDRCMKTKEACKCVKLSKRLVMCEKCGKKFTGSALKQHAPTCDPDLRFSCEKCNGIFLTKNKYETHLKKIADAPVCNYFKCKICFVKFSKAGFKEHIIEHPNYLCQICGKSYMCSNKLYTHVRTHNKRDPKQKATVVCQFCGKLVSTRGLRNHLKGHDLHKNGKKESCDICNKKFYTKWTLQKHKRYTHTGNKYPCDLCDKTFSSPSSAKLHFRVVHMKKPVATCEICHQEFSRRDYYRFHMRRHKDGNGSLMLALSDGRKQRPKKNPQSRHKCRLCNMTFQSMSNKDRHEKLHENPYYQFSCKICFARNKSEKLLREHIKKSHSKKPKKIYQCHHCNEQFKKKYFLIHHMRNAHPREPIEDKDKKMMEK